MISRLQKAFIGLLILYTLSIGTCLCQECVIKADSNYVAVYNMILLKNVHGVQKRILEQPDLKERALFAAVSLGQADLVTWLISKEVKLDCLLEGSDPGGQLLLTITTFGILKGNGKTYVDIVSVGYGKDHKDIVKQLVLAGAKSDIFYQALHSEDDNMISFLIGQGENINKVDEELKTLLMKACWLGHGRVARKLIEMGADVNVKDEFNRSAIFYAIQNNNTDIVRLLLEKGASLKSFDPLETPVQRKNIALVKLLLEHGANPDASAGHAACSKDSQLVKIFIQYKADFYGGDADGLDDNCYHNPAVHALLREYGVLSQKEYKAAINRGYDFYNHYRKSKEDITLLYRDSVMYFVDRWGNPGKSIMLRSARIGDTIMANTMITRYKWKIAFQMDIHNTESLFKVAIDHKHFDYVVFLIRMLPDKQSQKKLIESCIAYCNSSRNKKMVEKFLTL